MAAIFVKDTAVIEYAQFFDLIIAMVGLITFGALLNAPAPPPKRRR